MALQFICIPRDNRMNRSSFSRPNAISRRTFLVNSAAAALAVHTRRLSGQGATTPALVRTSAGNLRGKLANGVRFFAGVPFAQPPVGDLRFRPPLPAKPWTGDRDATNFSASPMQWNEFSAPGEGAIAHSEDCLYLNIWAPEGKGPFPVFVWIHGGSFISGHAFEPIFDGATFARQGIICITVAYRLGVFGFLDLSPLLGPDYHGSANNGVRDLILALGWIQANITAFGGDPARVTIGGESAGAKLTDTLMGVPSAQRLFHQMISESGGAERVWSDSDAILIADLYGEQWRIQSGKSMAALKTAPAGQLIEVQHAFIGQYPRHFPLRVEIDAKLLPQLPVKTIAAGSTKGKRLLVGTNRDESSLFVGPHPVDVVGKDLGNLPPEAFNKVLSRYREAFPDMKDFQCRIRALSAEEYLIPSIRVADAHLQGGGSAWVYFLDFAETSGRLSGFSYHGLDVPLVWEHSHRDPANAEAEAALAEQIHLAWAAFIRGEAPSAPGLPSWPQYSVKTRPTMLLDTRSRVEQNPQEAELKLWDGVL
jgi:para-nitrobenzyl esterase